jgi:hypothetical protein
MNHRPSAILPSEKRPLQLSLFSLPILCCACHRLKARNGKWSRRRVDQEWFPTTAFSHGICPACFKEQYPSAYRRRRRSLNVVPRTDPPRRPIGA